MRGFALLFLILLVSRYGWAEPLQPPLSQAAVDSLTRLLPQTAPDTNRVNVLLLLSQNLIDRHNELGTDLANADEYARQAQALSDKLHFTSGKIRSLFMLSRTSEIKEHSAIGTALVQEALALCRQQHYLRLEALGWYYLGEAHDASAPNLPEKMRCYQRAMRCYQQLGDKPKEAYLLKTIADIHLGQGQSAQALRELLQVLDLYHAAGYHKLHYTYDLLLAVNQQVGSYQAALRNGLAAIESAKATQDTAAIGGFYGRVAAVYLQINQLDSALVYYKKNLQNAKQGKTEFYPVLIANAIVRVLLLQKKPQQALDFFVGSVKKEPYSSNELNAIVNLTIANCYVALHSYKQAEQYYTRLLTVLEAGVNDWDRASGYFKIGKFYLLLKQYDKARLYLNKALPIATKLRLSEPTAAIHLALFKADSAQANYLGAMAHYQRYKVLNDYVNDSLFNVSKSKQIASLEIQYETRKKEQNIALLTQQNQLQQASLRQQAFQRNVTLAGAFVLCLLLGLGYSRYRTKQRSNQLLEEKQLEINEKNYSLELVLSEKNELLEEKDWMLKEIHHRVKNNLQIVNELLDSQTDHLRDAPTLAILRESQNRIQAMALVHQKLYQSQNLARVNMQEYIQEIVDHLLASFDRQGDVQVHLQVSEVELDVALATPVGLILNEAITNSLKHAFPVGYTGIILIELTRPASQQFYLAIADNGVGWPSGFDVAGSRSMGLTMIRGLSKQIDATLTFFQAPLGGVGISLAFGPLKLTRSSTRPS